MHLKVSETGPFFGKVEALHERKEKLLEVPGAAGLGAAGPLAQKILAGSHLLRPQKPFLAKTKLGPPVALLADQ